MLNAVKQSVLFNSSRARLDEEVAAFARTVAADALVLDAGAGTGPYRRHFDHTQYESADFHQVDKAYAASTYVCDLRSIPVDDERFDAVLFNQVMEHLDEPKLVLEELFRVLKPGGRMLYTGPFFYEEHEKPYDFFRYTQFGLTHLFGEAGYVVERLDWLEGYLGASAYQLTTMTRYLPSRPDQLGGGVVGLAMAPAMGALRVFFGACGFAFHRLEMRSKFTERGYPKNYLVVARKPG